MTDLKKFDNLPEIIEVKELLLAKDVNSHIRLGWKLIDTYKSINADKKLIINYCIGWPKSAGNIKNTQDPGSFPDSLPELTKVTTSRSPVKRNITGKKRSIYSI